MKKSFLIVILAVLLVVYLSFSKATPQKDQSKSIAMALVSQADRLEAYCALLQSTAEKKNQDVAQLQSLFLQTRLMYKEIEWAAEYFEPATSRFVNGPPVEEVEPSGQVYKPEGLQVIEGLLFPVYDRSNRQELVHQLQMLQERCGKYKKHFEEIKLFDWQILDAVKLEVFRLETLGLTGYDNPLTLNSMNECAASLTSMQHVVALYCSLPLDQPVFQFDSAIRYLKDHQDFNSFNRVEFIVRFCNPVTTSVADLSDRLHLQPLRYNRLLNQDAKTLFDSNTFNVNAFIPDQAACVTRQKIELGKRLFSDPVFSGNGKRSCASCHQPSRAFTDGLVKNTVISNNQLLKRNTPGLINAAFQSAQFYDLRASTLEDQSLDVVQSSIEMHGSMKQSAKDLWKNNIYRKLFAEAFSLKPGAVIDTSEVMNAISSYVRSLVSLNSRFDAYMRGKVQALNKREINGFNLFMGKARCGTCHYMPLFNGTLPPRYMTTEAEVIGTPGNQDHRSIDGDPGRYDVVHAESLRHAFKTPGLRNISNTSPYMHNGVFATLDEVVDFYNRGGGKGLGLKVDNQTLPFDQLHLTADEEQDIIFFLRSLNEQ